MKPKNLNDGNDNESGKKHKGKETRADAIIFSRNIYNTFSAKAAHFLF